MPENHTDKSPASPEIQTRLHEVSQMLRSSNSVQPEVREVLVELLEELNAALAASPLPPDQVAHLAKTTTHLAEALHHQQPGWLAKVRLPFEEAALQAESHAPVAVGLVRRLLDALANMGI